MKENNEENLIKPADECDPWSDTTLKANAAFLSFVMRNSSYQDEFKNILNSLPKYLNGSNVSKFL
jgi:hypothetical protein